MRQFYEAYRDAPEIVSPMVTQLSWTHHLILLSQCKTPEERQFYLILTVKERYSKRELERQIAAGVYERGMLSPSDQAVVEYALSRTLSPTLVADYTRQLPDKHLLEAKLAEFYQFNRPDTDPE